MISTKPKLCNGFSAIELLTTLAIVTILVSLAAPSFRELILNNHATARFNEFVAAVNYARSEAIKRGAPVTICSTTTPLANPTCNGGGTWSTGWIIFSDYDADQVVDAGTGNCATEEGGSPEDCILQVGKGLGDLNLTSARAHIVFDSTGASRGFNDTWKLCDERGAEYSRGVVLSNSGHLRLAKDADNNGIPEDKAGNDLTCP